MSLRDVPAQWRRKKNPRNAWISTSSGHVQGSDPWHVRGGRVMGRFQDALAGPGLAAIAEVKRRSPSAGDLRPDADPAELARSFEENGAAAVSILVDEGFAGSLADLSAARAVASLPLLAKGFFR